MRKTATMERQTSAHNRLSKRRNGRQVFEVENKAWPFSKKQIKTIKKTLRKKWD